VRAAGGRLRASTRLGSQRITVSGSRPATAGAAMGPCEHDGTLPPRYPEGVGPW
jgi:hypothetical protein